MTPAKTDPDAPAPAAVPTASEQAKAALDGPQRLLASAPDFFLHLEHEVGRDVLERMLDFLGLPRDETYLAAAADAFKVSGNARAAQPVDGCSGQVNRKFERHPAIRDALLKFAQR